MSDIFNKLLILRTPGIGPARYNDLLRRFETPAAVVDFLNVGLELRDSVMHEMDLATYY